jgi:hypothetical protein
LGVKNFLLVLAASLVACAPFEPGGSFNPISTRPNSGLSVKAGSSVYLNVFVGNAPNLGLSPAALYRQNRSEVSMSGSSRAWARVNAASLGGTAMPQGWDLSLNGDEVEVLAESSSFASFDSIQTQTQVSLGTYRLGAQLGVPSSAAAGIYNVQARVNLRGASPVTLDWTVTVTK